MGLCVTMLRFMKRVGKWRDVAVDEAAALRAELKRELCPSHCLYGLDAEPWLICWPGKDVAFTLPDGRVALVHLTFKTETSPAYPFCRVFASKAEALPRLALLETGEAYE